MNHHILQLAQGGIQRATTMLGAVAAQIVLIGLGSTISSAQVRAAATSNIGVDVLTRGPLHEAFAGVIDYNTGPGVLVGIAPPAAIEEIPPATRPAGENINWIPGYWGWDDERSDHLWISGTWRALPPGRQWVPGYWGAASAGYQWTSGYWADAAVPETSYLPMPPASLERGPYVLAPTSNHGWTPGSWIWNRERYAWRPGYWAVGRSDWDWIPDHYVWTRRGYVFVDGYWDYRFDRRGVVYAPVHIQSGYRSRPGYSYTPVIAIGLVSMLEHLFLRPNYHHYYFGDYYDRTYRTSGYYSPYSYQSGRYGYDAIYAHRRWMHRQEPDWEHQFQASYDYRSDHEDARPSRTWRDQEGLVPAPGTSSGQLRLIAAPVEEIARREEQPMRVERIPERERDQLIERTVEVRRSREQRRELERNGEAISSDDDAAPVIRPSTVRRPESPIVGKSADQFSAEQAPPRPRRNPEAAPVEKPGGRGSAKEHGRSETDRRQESRGTDPGRLEPEPRPAPTRKPDKKNTRGSEAPRSSEVAPEPNGRSSRGEHLIEPPVPLEVSPEPVEPPKRETPRPSPARKPEKDDNGEKEAPEPIENPPWHRHQLEKPAR